ncbi:GNAT family N-acetyltransferase [Nordella sp. HKS 07]|uniref:GNAT family N-acetyltransferase n=1 Tax=Nordella sp. HKS 07 TaxID=2712222 RepID=UPI0013E10151|nr:GNAT family N-acetyltransferase [Nordella sp. HKS 07]QIG47452.1 GNAT family N-acetyltransferase [Nordella sp. HKS 07]
MNQIVQPHDRLSRRVLDAEAIKALPVEDWDLLSREAVTENPAYSRQYVLAGLETIDTGARVRAVAMSDDNERLVGFFPFRLRILPPFPWPVAVGAQNIYQFAGAPLASRKCTDAVVGAWLDGIKAGAPSRFWTFSNIDLNSGFIESVRAQIGERGLGLRAVAPYRRPSLTGRAGSSEAHSAKVIKKSRVKDIERNLRRLRNIGSVGFERACEPEQVKQRIEQFLAIEQSGWKGENGTAFLSRERDATFARLAFGGEDGAKGLAVVDSLLLDGNPIAMSVNMSSGSTLFTLKCAYDENYRKFSPGLVLEYLVVEEFFKSGTFADMDASTTMDGHVIQELWDSNKPMACVIVGPDDFQLDLLAKGWNAFHNTKRRLRRPLKKLLRVFRKPFFLTYVAIAWSVSWSME